MKNSLSDLNNHLFMVLERLGDEDLSSEDLERELKRTDGVIKVSNQIISNANLALEVEKLRQKVYSDTGEKLEIPKMLGE